MDAMLAYLAAQPALEMAVPGEHRSIVLCESADQYALMDSMEALRLLPGVLNVLLVYHHAEPEQALSQSLGDSTAAGAPT
ncbi:hypothetical protein ABB29_01755 [Pseudoxanthomonas dokdonensis]|uniref:Nitrate reductase formation protein NapD n=2 Tax=Pseudoxanthomonas dokdonensis TaxID=344882 RepID=A0A0R0D140_9GAMM|nr:hypothetical protein ABB29_01755 [Pseudoxanthomonas dokdonensis]